MTRTSKPVDAAYLRLSFDRNGDELGVARQRATARKVARSATLGPLVEYVDNSVSADTARKPDSGYARLLADARAGRIATLVVWDLDRLTRHPRELEDWLDLCETHGVRIITADGECDTQSANGRMFLRFKGVVARHELEHKRARMRAKHVQRAESGKPWTNTRIYGWTRDWRIKPTEADRVREAFEHILAGRSKRSLLARWAAEGVRTSQGTAWTYSTLRDLLARPLYAGLLAHNGVEVGTAQVPVIVDEDTWRSVQVLLADPARRSNNGENKLKWPLTGIARCGNCGARMISGSVGTGGKRYRSLKCSAHRHLERHAEQIEGYVIEVVLERLRRPDAAALFEVAAPDLGPLRTRAAGLRAQREALAADLSVELDFAAARDKRLRADLDEVERELAEASTASAGPLGAFAGHREPGEVWAELDVEDQRGVIDRLLEVTVLKAWGGHGFRPETVRLEWRPQV